MSTTAMTIMDISKTMATITMSLITTTVLKTEFFWGREQVREIDLKNVGLER